MRATCRSVAMNVLMNLRPRAGFTALEMLIVLVIIGIVATITVPRIDPLALRVDSTERQVSMLLMRAQQLAMLRQHDVHVRFDTARDALVMHEDANGDGVVDAGETEHWLELEAGVRMVREGVPEGPPGSDPISFGKRQQSVPVLTFHRSGSASEAGGFYLGTHRSIGGDKPTDARALMVDRATGHLRRFYLEAGSWVQS